MSTVKTLYELQKEFFDSQIEACRAELRWLWALIDEMENYPDDDAEKQKCLIRINTQYGLLKDCKRFRNELSDKLKNL